MSVSLFREASIRAQVLPRHPPFVMFETRSGPFASGPKTSIVLLDNDQAGATGTAAVRSSAPRSAARLERFPGAPAARPCPLEIVAAEPAGDVDRFTNRIETRHVAHRHGLRRQVAGIDPAERHLSFGPALRLRGSNLPVLEA